MQAQSLVAVEVASVGWMTLLCTLDGVVEEGGNVVDGSEELGTVGTDVEPDLGRRTRKKGAVFPEWL